MFVNCFDHSYLCTGIIWCLLRGVAVPALFRANKEGSSCPAGLCGSCLAHASNEEVLCVSCKKLQENVWSKCSEKYIYTMRVHGAGAAL